LLHINLHNRITSHSAKSYFDKMLYLANLRNKTCFCMTIKISKKTIHMKIAKMGKFSDHEMKLLKVTTDLFLQNIVKCILVMIVGW